MLKFLSRLFTFNFRQPLIVVQKNKVEWTVEMGQAMRYFWSTPLGKELDNIAQGAMIEAMMRSDKSQYLAGLRDMYEIIIRQQSPPSVEYSDETGEALLQESIEMTDLQDE